MSKKYNDSPMLLNEGEVYLDGKKIFDDVTLEIKSTVNTWQGKRLGSRNFSSRITSVKHAGVMKRRKSTTWTHDILKKYLDSGETPEFTVQGRRADKQSDYYANNGKELVTCSGCVLTGDVSLLLFDADSDDVVTDEINFNIYKVDL